MKFAMKSPSKVVSQWMTFTSPDGGGDSRLHSCRILSASVQRPCLRICLQRYVSLLIVAAVNLSLMLIMTHFCCRRQRIHNKSTTSWHVKMLWICCRLVVQRIHNKSHKWSLNI